MPEVAETNIFLGAKTGEEVFLNLVGVMEKTVDVTFNTPFPGGPNLIPKCAILSAVQVDGNKDANLRYILRYSDLTKTGFKIHVRTYADTHVYEINVQWLVML